MTTGTFANLASTNNTGTGGDLQSQHTTLVSIGVILLVTIILIELAGTSRLAAIGVGFMFVSIIAIAGMTHSGNLQNISQYPAVP